MVDNDSYDNALYMPQVITTPDLNTNRKEKTVGLLVSNSIPGKLSSEKNILVQSYFAFACMYGVKFFMFSPADVDTSNKTVNGVFWEDNRFIKKVTPLPDLYVFRWGRPIGREFSDVKELLQQSCCPVYKHWNNKSHFNKWLKQGVFATYAIDTELYSTNSVKDFLSKHNAIILKPILGSHGMDIIKIEKKREDAVMIHSQAGIKEEKLENFLAEKHDAFMKRKYLMQAYINSTTLEGAPMDIRLCMARNGKGQWCSTALYFRFGGISNITTNTVLSTRSRSPYVLEVLRHQLGEQEGQRIFKEILTIQKSFPEYYQKDNKECKDFIIPEIALDIGIDRNNPNSLKFFEVGFTPGFGGIDTAHLTSTNIQFYKYLLCMR